MSFNSQRLQFSGHSGATLAARLIYPTGHCAPTPLFAHCFTCSRISRSAPALQQKLAREGIAVPGSIHGFGSSEGEFGSTNFSSNVADLALSRGLLRHIIGTRVLIGHSLGGARPGLAGDIPEVRAFATIGAPADVRPRLEELRASLERSRRPGQPKLICRAQVPHQKAFVESACTAHKRLCCEPEKPLLILHAPLDQTVGIENATEIFSAARHPKSFVSLDSADHLLTDPEDAAFADGSFRHG